MTRPTQNLLPQISIEFGTYIILKVLLHIFHSFHYDTPPDLQRTVWSCVLFKLSSVHCSDLLTWHIQCYIYTFVFCCFYWHSASSGCRVYMLTHCLVCICSIEFSRFPPKCSRKKLQIASVLFMTQLFISESIQILCIVKHLALCSFRFLPHGYIYRKEQYSHRHIFLFKMLCFVL